jgi:hypothetical protein
MVHLVEELEYVTGYRVSPVRGWGVAARRAWGALVPPTATHSLMLRTKVSRKAEM